ncbi:MAG TPA: hypothetical protein VJQ44_04255 [Gemmatimonadales bacterium]|nr:hypothetical protein [Gemmatimonadales bacterium]
MTRKRQKEQSKEQPEPARPTIKRDPHRSQLLERGEGPTDEELLDPAVESPSEVTDYGGPGTDSAYREGGPMTSPRPPVNPREGGTGGDGGYSTLGGGVYPDEGHPEDASLE